MRYLAATEWIDHDHPDVVRLARSLARTDAIATTRACFEWVRDEVRHAGDTQADPTTCRASDVLLERQGWCFAKSHLLVALVRANGIRAGLAYQRLAVDGEGARFSLHGLVSVDIPGIGWFRVDPRGSKAGIDARFEPPVERLAFAPRRAGEADLAGVAADPLPEVVHCLTTHETWADVVAHLPDTPPRTLKPSPAEPALWTRSSRSRSTTRATTRSFSAS